MTLYEVANNNCHIDMIIILLFCVHCFQEGREGAQCLNYEEDIIEAIEPEETNATR